MASIISLKFRWFSIQAVYSLGLGAASVAIGTTRTTSRSIAPASHLASVIEGLPVYHCTNGQCYQPRAALPGSLDTYMVPSEGKLE